MTSDLQTLIHTNAKLAFNQGVRAERERILQFLRHNKTLRDSLVSDGLVLYTEDGAIDITENELRGEED